jgi:hypothetical protein
MRDFHAVTDVGEFTVKARTVSAAYRRALRKTGTGHMITVEDGDRVLSGVTME